MPNPTPAPSDESELFDELIDAARALDPDLDPGLTLITIGIARCNAAGITPKQIQEHVKSTLEAVP